MDNKYRWKSLLLPAAVALVFLFLIFSLFSGNSRSTIAYSEIIGYFEDQKVTGYSLDFGTGRLQMSLNDPAGAIVTYDVPDIEMFVNETAPYVEESTMKPIRMPRWCVTGSVLLRQIPGLRRFCR